MPAKVQIIMPSFNRPKSVQIAIRSVLNQTFTDWKLYVMDNSSPQLYPTMQQTYSQYPDSRIKIDHTEVINELRCRMCWRSVVVNKALFTELSEKEPYVALSGDDAYMAPNKLELLAGFLDSHPEASVVSGQMEIVDAEGVRTTLIGGGDYNCGVGRIDTVQAMFRRSLLDRVGVLPTEYPLSEPCFDQVLFTRIAKLTNCCYGIPLIFDTQPQALYGSAYNHPRLGKGEVME